MSRIVINGAFRPQRITGQQRYATEVAARLLTEPDVEELQPTGLWARSTLLVWLWVQLVLPILAGNRVIVSMTSRAPIWRRRTVLVVHDLFVLNHPEWYSRRYVWTHAPLLRSQLKSAGAVVAVSEPVAKEMAGVVPGALGVAANAPGGPFYQEDDGSSDDQALRARGLNRFQYFLAVGSRDPRKNLPRLLSAYGGLSPDKRSRHPLVLVGASSSVFQTESLAIPTGVIEAGYVSDNELRQLYKYSKCVVLVSLAEGFGLPLVEAATAGARSLLVSNIPVFKWICGEEAQYVDPFSTLSIQEGLAEQSCRVSDGRRLDVRVFTWEEAAQMIMHLARTDRLKSLKAANSMTRTFMEKDR